ncbi:hypothetical protein C3489_20560 [Streptomyces sp. Ru71]|uniref:DUF3303 family protein n=1 Tax=Streptomyces sp. Ru71 TaxID=2080746 RepID=UPI000CDE27DF|nr:DUF3303 family protein [Streptomyces sp. Ru71]POX51129.1 hypothetical protein C3489_20560 [Streptomyces sp. Ru71]
MRVLLTVQMDTDRANKAIKDQTLPDIMKSTLERLNPEAAFFGAKDGMRTGFIVFDLQDPAKIPTIAEPFFQELGARIEFLPVMNIDEVQAGLREYGSG